MKLNQVWLMLCAAVFLFETGGANFVSAQKKTSKKTAPRKIAPKIAVSAQIAVAVPKVMQVDFPALQAVIKKNAAAKRPLLVNFWATWCPPCREEFPDLVQIDAEYRGKNLDFITVTLDDLAEINRDVPQFLSEMKATMPTYLLKTADEEAAIKAIAPDWRGALPLTILYDANGKPAYTKMGAVKPDILRKEIEKILPASKQ